MVFISNYSTIAANLKNRLKTFFHTMARLKAASAYRMVKRAYTRTSRKRAKAYVKGAPNVKVVQFDMGDRANSQNLPYEVQLLAAREIQIRDNALEAARQSAVRALEKKGKTGWALKIRSVPHQILREKAVATAAGADRFSQGMALSFGSPSGHAVQVKPGTILFSFYVEKDFIPTAREAARKASTKMPMRCAIRLLDNKTKKEITL